MKKLYTGPFSSIPRQIWVKEAIQRIKEDRSSSFLFIFPTQNLLKEVRQQLIEELGGVSSLHLLSFDEVAQKILDHAEPVNQSFTNYEFFRLHENLIHDALGEYEQTDIRSQLELPGVKNAFAHMMGELKRSGFTIEQALSHLNDPNGSTKIKSIARLFILLEEKVAALSKENQVTYLTTESRLEKAMEWLEKGEELPYWLEQLDTIWVDQFLDFTPLQFQLLYQLVSLPSIQKTGIYVPYQKERYEQYVRETKRNGIHVYLEQMLDRIQHEWNFERLDLTGSYQNMMKTLSQDWCVIDSTDQGVQEPHSDIWSLGETLFSAQRFPLPFPQAINLIPCASEKREAEMVFKHIKHSLLKNPQLKTSDIAIIMRDREKYQSYLWEVAKEEELPIQLSRECTLREIPLVQQIQAFLWIKESNWSQDLLVKLCHGTYVEWKNQPSPRWIRWMKQKGIVEGENHWSNALQKDMEHILNLQLKTTDEQEIQRLREEESHLTHLYHWMQELNQRLHIPRQGAIGQYIDQVSSVIASLHLEKVILNQKEVQYLKRDWRALQNLNQSLQEMKTSAKLLGELHRELTYSDFLTEWQQLWIDQRVELEKGCPDGIACLDPSSARGLQFKHVYVIGCNEGSFPSKQREHWLLDDTERLLIKEMSQLSTSHYDYEKEQLFFHMSIQSALDHITFTFVSPKSNENALVSSYIESVLKCYPEEWAVQQEDKWGFAQSKGLYTPDPHWISSKQEYRFWLSAKGREDADRLHHLFKEDWLPENHGHILDGIQLDYMRKFGPFSKWDGFLQHPKEERRRSQENEKLRHELSLLYSESHRYSVSQINEYMSSPLTFFFKRILRTQPIETFEQDVSPVNKGNILHEALRRFFTCHRGEVLPSVHLKSYQEELIGYLREEASSFAKGTLYEHSAIWMLEVEKLAEDLQIWIQNEVELGEKARAKGGQLTPQYFELSFGLPYRDGDRRDERSDEHPVQIDLGEDKIWLYGIIDRMDVDDQGRFVIYDYKSSLGRYEKYWKLKDGYTFQIPLYLYAMKKWLMNQKNQEFQMIGGGYYSLKPTDSTKKIGLWNEAQKQLIAVGSKGTDQIESRILEHLGDIQDGLRKLKAGHFYLTSKHFTNSYFADNALYRYESIYLKDKERRREGEVHHDTNHPGKS